MTRATSTYVARLASFSGAALRSRWSRSSANGSSKSSRSSVGASPELRPASTSSIARWRGSPGSSSVKSGRQTESSLIAQSLDRTKAGRTAGRVAAEEEADGDRDAQRERDGARYDHRLDGVDGERAADQ